MAVKNSLATQAQKPSFSTYMMNDARKAHINSMIGGKDGQRFISAVVSAVSTNPALANCDYGTILSAALLGESLKLSPSPQLGYYYMVPFEDKSRGSIATFILGYKGYIQLAQRTGAYKRIIALPIKEGEFISYNPLTEELKANFIEDEIVREQKQSVGYYASFEYINGFQKALYWSREKMEAHALQYSKGYQRDKQKGTAWTFWSKDFDSMAIKTMLRRLISRWGIMSTEMQMALERDDAVIREDGTFEYFDGENASTGAQADTAANDVMPEPERAKQSTPSASAVDEFFSDVKVDPAIGEIIQAPT